MDEAKTLVGEESSVGIRQLEPIVEGIRAAEGYSSHLVHTPGTNPIRETRSRCHKISQGIPYPLPVTYSLIYALRVMVSCTACCTKDEPPVLNSLNALSIMDTDAPPSG